jgi:hypothetical protein
VLSKLLVRPAESREIRSDEDGDVLTAAGGIRQWLRDKDQFESCGEIG